MREVLGAVVEATRREEGRRIVDRAVDLQPGGQPLLGRVQELRRVLKAQQVRADGA